MSSVTLQFSPDTEQRLRDKAERLGQTLEVYLQHLAEKALGNGPLSISINRCRKFAWYSYSWRIGRTFEVFLRPKLIPDEVEHLLDEFSSGLLGKVLPSDFSRADIYEDHD